MPIEIETKSFVCSKVGPNNNKVWEYTLYDNDDVEVRWGRIGKKKQSKYHTGRVRVFVDKMVKSKTGTKKGYREIELLKANVNGQVAVKTGAAPSLKDVAKTQIKHTNPLVGQLIEFLAKANRHNIYQATGGRITWNDAEGLFTTPLGIVTLDSVQSARVLLGTLGGFVAANDWSSKPMTDALEAFLTLIPQDIGMKFKPKVILPDMQAVQKQNDTLDALESSYQSVASGEVDTKVDDQPADTPKVFDLELELVEDPNLIRNLSRLFESTKQSFHYKAAGLRVAKVYTVNRGGGVVDRFAATARKIGNVQQLWHGTRASNLLSILKGGLIIPPSGAAHVTGRMFGNGLYFTDQSTKALNYAVGYWDGGSRDQRTFMFLADIAMGSSYSPRSHTERLPKPGYDSTFAKAHYSGVQNNEMIVYSLGQVLLRFLVEFE